MFYIKNPRYPTEHRSKAGRHTINTDFYPKYRYDDQLCNEFDVSDKHV